MKNYTYLYSIDADTAFGSKHNYGIVYGAINASDLATAEDILMEEYPSLKRSECELLQVDGKRGFKAKEVHVE